MFVLSHQGNRTERVVAMLLAFVLVLGTIGFHTSAEAANLTNVTDTLSDSDRGVDSDHTIAFTVPAGSAGVSAGQTMSITFPNGFNISTSTVDFSDIDLSIGGSDVALAAAPSGATWGAAIAGQVLTFTSGTGVVTAGQEVIVQVGLNATFGVAGDQQVTNPIPSASYKFYITLPADEGETIVAILDDVLVTAAVDSTFTFTVNGFTAAGADVNGETTTGTSSATEIPFGTLSAGVAEVIAQRLNVTTNAIGGFIVTVEQSQDLLSSTGADIDSFIEGAYTNTPAAWQSPVTDIGDDNTWGHWGLTSSDDLNTNEFGANLWVAASTTPRQVFEHDGPADGTTANIGSTTVGYQVEITALQEAAEDYNTLLTYIATPRF